MLLLLFGCSVSDSWAQEKSLSKFQSKNLSETNDNVNSTLFNYKNGKSLRVFQNKIKNGESIIGFENGVITEEGRIIKFSNKNEEAILFNDNVLTTYSTVATHEDEGITEVRAYQIVNSKLKLIKLEKIRTLGVGCKIINEGQNIVLDDFVMEAGMNFVFFDKKLRHLNTYTPFKTGSSFYACNSNTDHSVIVCGENNTNNYKIAYFDKFCKLIKENSFTLKEKFRLNTLYIIGNQVVISGLNVNSTQLTPHLYCISNKGDILWDKNMTLGLDYKGLGIVGNDRIAYALNHKTDFDRNHFITSFNPITGKYIAEININKDFSDSMSKDKSSKNNLIPWVNDFKMDDNDNLLVVLAQLFIDSDNNDSNYQNGQLLMVDNILNAKIITSNLSSSKFFKIEKFENKIRLLNSSKIYYENEK